MNIALARNSPNPLLTPIVFAADEERKGNIEMVDHNLLAQLENEELIANENEVLDYKNLIQCMICQDLTLLSKDPEVCTHCQTAVFCHGCIT